MVDLQGEGGARYGSGRDVHELEFDACVVEMFRLVEFRLQSLMLKSNNIFTGALELQHVERLHVSKSKIDAAR